MSPEALHMTSIPDFLILPSDMKYFIKVVSLVEGQGQRKSICINPGTLAKGEGVGTFAELKYHGSADKMNACIIRSI
ncbi:DNA polymerase 2 ALPHA 70 KDA SUBUNIT [Salix purpurea]|uniref:DNA polymerase 2 ALPHA 70 kDa SUBUNIT n=1 Tax=Salix purpurea TaxID=77065 RepID=A0A9Q0U9C5_SALPP|nr:DNA polymerase 2 ALPHA 70 KDA SUBUNIT [Salix purpurea]